MDEAKTEEGNTIHVWNKGRRTWDLIDVNGKKMRVGPQESIEMSEAKGYKLIADYHRDWTASKASGPSTEDLKRREQSLRDREAAMKVKEEALEARIQKVREREDALRPAPDKAALLEEAKALGLTVDGRMGADKIKALIDEAKAAQ